MTTPSLLLTNVINELGMKNIISSHKQYPNKKYVHSSLCNMKLKFLSLASIPNKTKESKELIKKCISSIQMGQLNCNTSKKALFKKLEMFKENKNIINNNAYIILNKDTECKIPQNFSKIYANVNTRDDIITYDIFQNQDDFYEIYSNINKKIETMKLTPGPLVDTVINIYQFDGNLKHKFEVDKKERCIKTKKPINIQCDVSETLDNSVLIKLPFDDETYDLSIIIPKNESDISELLNNISEIGGVNKALQTFNKRYDEDCTQFNITLPLILSNGILSKYNIKPCAKESILQEIKQYTCFKFTFDNDETDNNSDGSCVRNFNLCHRHFMFIVTNNQTNINSVYGIF